VIFLIVVLFIVLDHLLICMFICSEAWSSHEDFQDFQFENVPIYLIMTAVCDCRLGSLTFRHIGRNFTEYRSIVAVDMLSILQRAGTIIGHSTKVIPVYDGSVKDEKNHFVIDKLYKLITFS
jgi:hypothetical protein